MVEPAGAGHAQPRAFLRMAGKTIARHQLDAVLALECDRLVCLARGLAPEVMEIQHAAEAAGLTFHMAASPTDLARFITANDELIVFTEGLTADPADVSNLLRPGHAVLVQPVEEGLVAGFERIDINHATAGLIRVPGRLLEGLLQLGGDCDVASALTRIALQSGVAMREVPAAARLGVNWRMVRSENDAAELEIEWLRRRMGDGRGLPPGRFIANRAMLIFGTSLLQAGNASRMMAIASGAGLAIAICVAWLGFIALGLLFCAMTWIALQAARKLQRVEGRNSGISNALTALDWTFDGVLVLLMFWGAKRLPWESVSEHVFAPLILVLLVRLLAMSLRQFWTDWVADRALLSLLLAVMTALGIVGEAIRILAVCLMFAGIFLSNVDRD